MPKFAVNYSSSINYEIIVEAKSAEEAWRMVEQGEADFDTAKYQDEQGVVVNNVEEVADD